MLSCPFKKDAYFHVTHHSFLKSYLVVVFFVRVLWSELIEHQSASSSYLYVVIHVIFEHQAYRYGLFDGSSHSLDANILDFKIFTSLILFVGHIRFIEFLKFLAYSFDSSYKWCRRFHQKLSFLLHLQHQTRIGTMSDMPFWGGFSHV